MWLLREDAGWPGPAASKRPGVRWKFRVHVPEKPVPLLVGPSAPGATSGNSEPPSSQLRNSPVLSNAIKLSVNNFATPATGVRVTREVARILSLPGSLSAKFEGQQRAFAAKWTYSQRSSAPSSQRGAQLWVLTGGRCPDRGLPGGRILGEQLQAVPGAAPSLSCVLGEPVTRPWEGLWGGCDQGAGRAPRPVSTAIPGCISSHGAGEGGCPVPVTRAAVLGFAVSLVLTAHVDGLTAVDIVPSGTVK